MRGALEHRERPQSAAVVFSTTLLEQIQQGVHGLRSDADLLERPAVAEPFTKEVRQVVAEPRSNRHSEPSLGARQHFVGHPAAEDAPEQVFGLVTAQAKTRRQPTSELHQGMVQQGHPRLQGMRHSHPVYLGQDVPGQVGLKIQILKTRECIEALAILQSLREERGAADATPPSSRSRRARSGNKEIASR